MQIEAQIAHSTRKRDNAQKVLEQVSRDAEKQHKRLDSIRRDLAAVRNAADAAQGMSSIDCAKAWHVLMLLHRGLSTRSARRFGSERRQSRGVPTSVSSP